MKDRAILFSTSRVTSDHLSFLTGVIKNIKIIPAAYTAFAVFYGIKADKITLKIFVVKRN